MIDVTRLAWSLALVVVSAFSLGLMAGWLLCLRGSKVVVLKEEG